jgi:hypothetical protein
VLCLRLSVIKTDLTLHTPTHPSTHHARNAACVRPTKNKTSPSPFCGSPSKRKGEATWKMKRLPATAASRAGVRSRMVSTWGVGWGVFCVSDARVLLRLHASRGVMAAAARTHAHAKSTCSYPAPHPPKKTEQTHLHQLERPRRAVGHLQQRREARGVGRAPHRRLDAVAAPQQLPDQLRRNEPGRARHGRGLVGGRHCGGAAAMDGERGGSGGKQQVMVAPGDGAAPRAAAAVRAAEAGLDRGCRCAGRVGGGSRAGGRWGKARCFLFFDAGAVSASYVYRVDSAYVRERYKIVKIRSSLRIGSGRAGAGWKLGGLQLPDLMSCPSMRSVNLLHIGMY